MRAIASFTASGIRKLIRGNSNTHAIAVADTFSGTFRLSPNNSRFTQPHILRGNFHMRNKHVVKPLALAVSLLFTGLAHSEGQDDKIRHVLMVSVDGMHQQDLDRCVAHGTCPNIAELAEHGIIYTKAFTPGLSDSVPGLAALVTGGSPLSTGLFYDDVYDRTLYPGTDPTSSTTPAVEVFLQELVGVDNFNRAPLFPL